MITVKICQLHKERSTTVRDHCFWLTTPAGDPRVFLSPMDAVIEARRYLTADHQYHGTPRRDYKGVGWIIGVMKAGTVTVYGLELHDITPTTFHEAPTWTA